MEDMDSDLVTVHGEWRQFVVVAERKIDPNASTIYGIRVSNGYKMLC
jgi:hypothetical protein